MSPFDRAARLLDIENKGIAAARYENIKVASESRDYPPDPGPEQDAFVRGYEREWHKLMD